MSSGTEVRTAPAGDPSTRGVSRRKFIAGGLAAGIGVGLGPLGHTASAVAGTSTSSGPLSAGDAAILRFLAAAELLETDLWQQYNELGGIQDAEVPGGSGSPAYTKALQKLDGDMPQYIHDNTDDEFTHAAFINGYLKSRGARTGRISTVSGRSRAARQAAPSRSGGSPT